MFEEAEYVGKKKIGSRWVISGMKKHEGQKVEVKARIVLRIFQEENKPQSDAPTVL